MNDIRIDRNAALEVLRKNREAHRAIFLDACEGYKAKALQLLEQHVADLRIGKLVQVAIALPFPEDHTKDYDRVIKMLEMCLDETIQMDEETFGQFVMDDWQWKRQFLASNRAYSRLADTAYQADYVG